MRIALALCLLNCSSSNQSVPSSTVKMTVTQLPSPVVDAQTQADDGIEELGIEKLPVVRFTKATVLYKMPDVNAETVGTIRKDARAAVLREALEGSGCKTRWIEIAPRGWTCDVTTEPTTEAPTKPRTYSLTDEDPTPPVTGVYGVVRGKNTVAYDSKDDAAAGAGRELVGNNSVRAAGSVMIDGKRFWRTTGGDLIDAKSIATFSPSKYRGVIVTDKMTMPAWVRGHGKPREPVVTRAQPSARAKASGKVAWRSVVTILEERDGFARIGENAWLPRKDLRATTLTEPPPGTGAHEKWFDIDLDDQVLVAYEGANPVYATMVSTGKYKHPTPVVITRIASKLERTTMASNKEDVYSVADVPWTMFYDGNYAVHTSYWHDGFGSVRSHGCINLAPHDARLLFRWSSPDVPPGWTSVRGDEENPGSLVRVRSSKLREPSFRGYAKRLVERETAPVATR
ncbi:MAG: L,D-transpeptidase [Deltaproteobacteria bacterium]|nr:L,D-transpeptidase [Deltaproteobacteria bacterium]